MNRFFYLKRHLLNPAERRWAREWRRHESLSADQLATLNRNRRRDLLAFAFRQIPFYRRKYAACGITPADMESPDICDRLPILDKEEIREYANEIRNPAFKGRKLPVFTTGGTTGMPLTVYGDPRIPLSAMSWRTLHGWGVDAADNSGYLYRAVPEGWHKTLQQIVLWPTRRVWLSAARMHPDAMQRFYRDAARCRIRYLVGYVGAIDAFADFMSARGYTLPSLNAVWTASSPLPEIKRDYFQRIFQCKTYTQYGCCELYWIAAECTRQAGLHIADDIRHVDVVHGNDPAPDGEYGDIVVTDLLNRAFPLIRYRLGDRGRRLTQSCPCGLPFSLMDYVQGRTTDTLWTRDGTALPGEFWTTIFDDYPQVIKSFQVHQRADYTVTLSYEPHAGVDARHAVDAVRSRLNQRYGDSLEIKIRQADINTHNRGKIRFVISEVHGALRESTEAVADSG